ncbi:MAG: aminoacyl-tRNA hydrolase [bacterium]|nr:aminoacyl-tRNA hydrolase [bacterium]
MKLFFASGNPDRFKFTRHNIAKDIFLDLYKMKEDKDFYYLEFTNHIVVASNGYVNESGIILKNAMEKFGISIKDAVYVYDEFQIEFGRIKISKIGTSGGHNGVKSVIDIFGEGFVRIKIGIGPKPKFVDPKIFVLSKFSNDELKKIPMIKERLKEIIDFMVLNGVDKTMSLYNSK